LDNSRPQFKQALSLSDLFHPAFLSFSSSPSFTYDDSTIANGALPGPYNATEEQLANYSSDYTATSWNKYGDCVIVREDTPPEDSALHAHCPGSVNSEDEAKGRQYAELWDYRNWKISSELRLRCSEAERLAILEWRQRVVETIQTRMRQYLSPAEADDYGTHHPRSISSRILTQNSTMNVKNAQLSKVRIRTQLV
jgi:hypothetical protein